MSILQEREIYKKRIEALKKKCKTVKVRMVDVTCDGQTVGWRFYNYPKKFLGSADRLSDAEKFIYKRFPHLA